MALVYYKCKNALPPGSERHWPGRCGRLISPPAKTTISSIASIDPADTPADGAAEKVRFLDSLGTPGAGIQRALSHRTSRPRLADLASATGFNYVRVPGPDGKMDQFAHSSVIMIATPDGRMSKYLFGIDYQPRDVRLAVIEASNHHIGSVSDLILLYCCNYSPSAGKYTVSILRVMGLGRYGVSLPCWASACFLRYPGSQSRPPPTPDIQS